MDFELAGRAAITIGAGKNPTITRGRESTTIGFTGDQEDTSLHKVGRDNAVLSARCTACGMVKVASQDRCRGRGMR